MTTPNTEPGRAENLLERIKIAGLHDDHLLVVMCQNPANNYHWSKSVGEFRTGEVRAALLLSAASRHVQAARSAGPKVEERSCPIPQTEEEAALMAILGTNWLEEHAPHRLKPHRPFVQPSGGGGWRDIASAPRDGTRVLVAQVTPEYTNIMEARFCTPYGLLSEEPPPVRPSWWGLSWRVGDSDWPAVRSAARKELSPYGRDDLSAITPTHWMPLPAAPVPEGEG